MAASDNDILDAIRLTERADTDGWSRANNRELAELAGVSERTVTRWIALLAKEGRIESECEVRKLRVSEPAE